MTYHDKIIALLINGINIHPYVLIYILHPLKAGAAQKSLNRPLIFMFISIRQILIFPKDIDI